MKLKWTTERRKLSELTRYERNPRLVTDKGKQELNDSVEEFGYAVPLTINTDGTIIGGHQRYEKALADGETEIECTVPERVLTAGEVKRLNVRLNKNIAGTFDYDLLKEDYDLNELYDLGFEEEELKIEIDTEEKEIVETAVAPIVKRGDIFQIGVHRVMCGDSTDAGDVALLMDAERVDIVFTDPPFPNNSGIMSDMIEGIESAFISMRQYCSGTIISFWDNLSFPPIEEMLTSKYIWHKTNGWQANHFETMYLFHGDNVRHEQFVFSETNVGGTSMRDEQGNHPTPKPRKMILNVLKNFEFNSVLDLFLGSGQVLLAVNSIGKKCYGMEIDPRYIEVCLRRFAENCSDDNGNVEFQHCNGTLTLDQIVANV